MSSIKRKPHVLKSEKTLAMPRHIIFFDTETWQNEKQSGQIQQSLRLGWVCYYRRAYGRHTEVMEWLYFVHPNQFWQFVGEHTQSKNRVWVIARNVAFDFTILKGWTHLRRLRYKLKFFHNKGTCNIISVRNKDRSIVFLDSMNWFRESLAKTGERIGLPKLSIDFKTCTQSELKTYCHRDVEIEVENFKLFIRFLEVNKVARLCYTAGSTAMAAFLLGHYNTKIYIHNNEQAINLERESYKGGRVECFFLGVLKNDNYYFLDVNSLYPFVMRNNMYPVKYVKILHRMSLVKLNDTLLNYSVTAKVLIDTDEPVYAVRRERTIFPVGRFWTTLTTPELKHAMSKGHIKKVGDAVVYEQENIFESFIDKFYDMRLMFKKKGNREYEQFCKYIMNKLYGKFGQKGENWTKIGNCQNEPDREELVFNMDGRRVTKIRYLLGEVFMQTGVGECFDSFPAIAAHVTGHARIYLWSLMQQAGWGNYYYCDTDSLVVNEVGLCNLENSLSPSGLGGLKIDERCVNVTIRGLKDYSTVTKNVIKGIRKNAIEISHGVYTQEKWPSFRGLLRSGQPENYVVETVTKHLTREYHKGNVTPSGVVLPYVFADEVQRQYVPSS
ncbi:hypothetical protein ES705_14360 [subsurface metagenome]